jgi:hypothetical protein
MSARAKAMRPGRAIQDVLDVLRPSRPTVNAVRHDGIQRSSRGPAACCLVGRYPGSTRPTTPVVARHSLLHPPGSMMSSTLTGQWETLPSGPNCAEHGLYRLGHM